TDWWKRTQWPDSIISLNCLTSLDGENVLTYIQSKSHDIPFELNQSDRVHSDSSGTAPDLVEVEWAHPIQYRIRRSVFIDEDSKSCTCLVIAGFDVDGPERQRQIIDTMVESFSDAEPQQYPGLISAHFH